MDKVGEVWIESYQPQDENGAPIGPPQKFEGKTQQEVAEKMKAAHINASVKLYQLRKANKLGLALEPDPDEPIKTFEGRQLSADERIKASKMLSDPSTVVEGYKMLSEAVYGAPPEAVQESLRDREIQKRIEAIREAVNEFKRQTPEYVESQSNGETLKKYMEKNNLRYTVKNLKIAYEDLANEQLLTVRASQAVEPTPPPVIPAGAAPAVAETIPPQPTNAPAIPDVPTDVRAKQSSSGLRRDNSSAIPGLEAPKTAGITIRDINKMTAKEYQDALRDPEFRKQVDALYAKK